MPRDRASPDAGSAVPAVVIGLCAHGLAIARALARAGIPVVGLEARRDVPGVRTAYASVIPITDMNGPVLIEELVRVRPSLSAPEVRPVLFPTNDSMIEQLSTHAQHIAPLYRLSWIESADSIRPLLRKDEIEARCHDVGLNYPKTVVLRDNDLANETLQRLRFPVILKPVRPLGRFKTAVIQSGAELNAVLERLVDDLPLIAQEFIPGDDTTIRFAAMVLENGVVRARFEGRKLRSRPMGHTTIAVSEPDERLHELALRFFEGLCISGPVSLELKRDPSGADWVIEPTVGRSDFWVGLCIANGVNLPVAEYLLALGEVPEMREQSKGCGWINGERDPGGLLWLLAKHPSEVFGRRWRGVYVDAGDLRPLLDHWSIKASRLPERAFNWLRRRLSAPP